MDRCNTKEGEVAYTKCKKCQNIFCSKSKIMRGGGRERERQRERVTERATERKREREIE